MRATDPSGIDTDPTATLAMTATISAPTVQTQGEIDRLGAAFTALSGEPPF